MRPIDADIFKQSLESVLEKMDLAGESQVDIADGVKRALRLLEIQPEVDAAPVVHGKWREVDDECVGTEWCCTACRQRRAFMYDMSLDEMKECYLYCPNCGAKMDKDEV